MIIADPLFVTSQKLDGYLCPPCCGWYMSHFLPVGYLDWTYSAFEKLLQYCYELYGIFTLFFYKSLSHSVVDGLFWRELT
jgi:hypothetical protein